MKPVDRLLGIMAQLRSKENGCPWDVEQNFASIAPHTLEEAYEVVDAVERNDMEALREELGDLLLQVVFHAQMARERELFTFDDVAQAICDKLIRRHPHVFGDAQVKDAAAQSEAWEKIKSEEKKKANNGMEVKLFADIPSVLPAIMRALKLQKKAARIGFDWPGVDAVFEKLDEEVRELQEVLKKGKNPADMLEEIGDMMFCCVNLARKLEVDPEAALRLCNRKFESRFAFMQSELGLRQRDLGDASLQELGDLWDQAKIAEKSPLPQGWAGTSNE